MSNGLGANENAGAGSRQEPLLAEAARGKSVSPATAPDSSFTEKSRAEVFFRSRAVVTESVVSDYLYTSSKEVAAIASKSKPETLVLYHLLNAGTTDEELVAKVQSQGKVVVAHDVEQYP